MNKLELLGALLVQSGSMGEGELRELYEEAHAELLDRPDLSRYQYDYWLSHGCPQFTIEYDDDD